MSQAAESRHHSGLARTIRVLQNHVGIDEAVSAKDLAERVGSHPSTVRNWIEELRQQGWPIGSKNGAGYYLFASDAEYRDWMQTMEQKRESIAQTMRVVTAAKYGDERRRYFGSGRDE